MYEEDLLDKKFYFGLFTQQTKVHIHKRGMLPYNVKVNGRYRSRDKSILISSSACMGK